jgi:glycosyltransferase involved in cell wall biosynthesis
VNEETRAPRLLHLTTTSVSLDWLLAPQLRAFSAAGFDVCTASAPGPHVADLTRKGIVHYAVPSLTRNMDLRSDVRAARELRALFRAVQPDIVHTHNPKPGVLGRLLARSMDVPIVVNTVHGLYAQPTDSVARRTAVYGAERIAASCSDGELVQNVEDLSLMGDLGIPQDRIHLLGNGIDLSRFSPSVQLARSARALRSEFRISATTPIVGIVGRLVWEKGFQEFFDAITWLRERRGEDFAVVVVGPEESGKTGAVDKATIAAMAAEGVHFLGPRTDVETILSMLNVFVLPSYREGFPRAAMEASAMGVPVVATDIRGCRQVVEHGSTGLLVPARDSAALGFAINDLLDRPDQRVKMGRAARAKAAAQFDQERVIARTLAVYRSLLEKRGFSPPLASNERYIASIDLVATEASNPEALSPAA